MKVGVDVYKEILENISDGVYFLDVNRKILHWNNGAAKLSGFTPEEVLGFSCADNILLHTDKNGVELCKSGCPVTEALLSGEEREADVYMRHRNGYRVPVAVKVLPVRDAVGGITGAVEIFREDKSAGRDKQVMDELKRTALIDPLTGLANRRDIEMRLNHCFAGMKRYGIPFGVIFCDIDNFKNVNDTFGHRAGDSVLKMAANTLKLNLRTVDFIGRWGGEEFMLLITHLRDRRLLMTIAQKLRLLVGASFIEAGGRRIKVTITMGCTIARNGDTVESIVERADVLLYAGKTRGKNCVVAD